MEHSHRARYAASLPVGDAVHLSFGILRRRPPRPAQTASARISPWPSRSHASAACAKVNSCATLVRETRLTPEAFVYPLFVCPGEGVRKEVRSMPGVFNLSVDEAVKEARETAALGVPAVILFGLPENKDEVATGAWAEDGIVQQAARAIKREVPDLIIMGDVCLCEYMSHGHCGVVRSRKRRNLWERQPSP